MSQPSLKGRKIAILATDGFEQSELQKPKQLLEEAGAVAQVVAPGDAETIKGWKGGNWGESVKVDVALDKARPSDYDALVLPGGVINPDKLRLQEKAIGFIKAFGEAGKPIAAICHGPWTLIDAGLVDGKQVTSWPSLKIDLTNAGAQWEDSEVVVDGNLITSRKPDDIPVFVNALIAAIATRGAKAA